jgi:uncharacterized protein YeaO (DUF488 family)
MQEANDDYMGYAEKNELTSFLNELIEAERAGARVTLASSRAAGVGPTAKLLRAIQRDEARWCAMLVRHVKALGERPSANTGAFFDKAMAIADLEQRVVFLNRGQSWVVRKLREMLPRVRDDKLRGDLAAMLRSQEANIALAEKRPDAAADSDVCIKRVYEMPSRKDGYRVLVDRIWPRGVKKEAAKLDEWLRDVAPSTALRKWFAHQPEHWALFRDRYLAELTEHTSLLESLRERASRQRVTLLYAARDQKLNHAVVLKECLEARPAKEQRDAH